MFTRKIKARIYDFTLKLIFANLPFISKIHLGRGILIATIHKAEEANEIKQVIKNI